MIKRFPVAWMTMILAVLTSGDAIAAYSQVLTKDQMIWVNAAVAVLTLVLGKMTHSAVTPLADPKTDYGRKLVPAGTAAASSSQ